MSRGPPATRGAISVRPEPCRRVGVWPFDAAPIPFDLSCAQGFRVAWGRPSTRLRTGLPEGPHPNLPPPGGRDYWFTSWFFVPPGIAQRGSTSVRPELCRRVGVGLPGGPMLTFPQRGEGTIVWSSLPAGLPIWDGLPGCACPWRMADQLPSTPLRSAQQLS